MNRLSSMHMHVNGKVSGLFHQIAIGIVLTAGVALSANFYVDGSVATSGNGQSTSAAFKTIQEAASLMQAGDACYVRAGTYRELVTVANSGTTGAPITFTNYQNEVATISGADLITGWTVHQGNIYKATMNWDMGDGQNQVFVNGQQMISARFPNTGLDLLHPKYHPWGPGMKGDSTNVQCSTNSAIFRGANQTANFWVGATFWGAIGADWTSQTAKVTASTASTASNVNPEFTVTLSSKSSPWFPDDYSESHGGQGKGYLTGILGALDTAGEFHYENNILYLMAPGNANPSTVTVEAKHRAQVFNFNGKSYVVVRGLNLACGGVQMNGNNNTIINCSIKYLNHYTLSSGYSAPTGIAITGSGQLIYNSEIAYAAGSLVGLGGSNNRIAECNMYYSGLNGNYAACINLSGNHNVVERNDLHDVGRWCVHLGGSTDTIRNNHMYNFDGLSWDGGACYTYGRNGQQTEVSYNWVHNTLSRCLVSTGIYLDDRSSNYVVHHNVCWNTVAGGILAKGTGHTIVNNTGWNYRNYDNQDKGVLDMTFNPTGTIANNLSLGDTPTQLVDPANFNFTLKPGAAAIDAGTVVAPYTNGFIGPKPDLGAYEYGASTRWTAGRTNGSPTPVVKPINSSSVVNPANSAIQSFAVFTVNGKCVQKWSAVGTLFCQKAQLPGFGVYIIKFKTANGIQANHVMALSSQLVSLDNFINN